MRSWPIGLVLLAAGSNDVIGVESHMVTLSNCFAAPAVVLELEPPAAGLPAAVVAPPPTEPPLDEAELVDTAVPELDDEQALTVLRATTAVNTPRVMARALRGERLKVEPSDIASLLQKIDCWLLAVSSRTRGG